METLKNNRDFERVFRKGRSASHRDLVVLGRKRRPYYPRVGFCISRKSGKAVERNKLRRRMKEIVTNEITPGEVIIFLFEIGDFSGVQRSADMMKECGCELLNSLKAIYF